MSPTPKQFNATGPCVPEDHYHLPPLTRLPKILSLVKDGQSFVIHAPHQSGKTTIIQAARRQINAEGEYYALICYFYSLPMVTDLDEAMSHMIGLLYGALSDYDFFGLNPANIDRFLKENSQDPNFKAAPIKNFLNFLAASLDKDLVIFFVEPACLTIPIFISFLSQLSSGFWARARSNYPFPRSIGLVDMRDIINCQFDIRPQDRTWGQENPFDFLTAALRPANFTLEEVRSLYAQHTAGAGQIFLDEAVEKAYHWTDGQPWLVNALAYEAVNEILGRDYGPPITAKIINEAVNNLLNRRDVHLDFCRFLLGKPKAQTIIRPMLDLKPSPNPPSEGPNNQSLSHKFKRAYHFCLDMGLIKGDIRSYQPANHLYARLIS
ncbi:MAG: ATP-binding protein [Deltaproteobacteria bacterium]|jgi:hypothetical protein|nr:ATP-binding protein [Deltaproteobacteria bacterium]